MNLEHIFNQVFKNCTSIVANNGVITVNGKIVNIPSDTKVINITVEQNCGTIQVDSCNQITVKGNVGEYVRTTNGDVEIGQGVGTYVETTNGDVHIKGDVQGSIHTVNGDVSK